MRWACFAFTLFGLAPTTALAQFEGAPGRVRSHTVQPIPPAATGFDLALRLGVAIPLGDATGEPGDSLASRYAMQYPVALDIGFKPIKALFFGAYASFAYGGPGSDSALSEACAREDTSCGAYSIGWGGFAQYNLGPSERLNPWFGLGLGYESTTQTFEQPGHSESHETWGMTAIKLMGGLDYRTVVGLGPFAELSVGRFAGRETELNDRRTHYGPVEEAAWHSWVTLGMRGVLFP